MGKNDVPRTVDDRSQATLVESCFDVVGRPTLSAKAGDQDPAVRHCSPQFGQLFWVGCTDDRTDRSVPSFVQVVQVQLRHQFGDSLVNGLPVS